MGHGAWFSWLLMSVRLLLNVEWRTLGLFGIEVEIKGEVGDLGYVGFELGLSGFCFGRCRWWWCFSLSCNGVGAYVSGRTFFFWSVSVFSSLRGWLRLKIEQSPRKRRLS
ncbi:uncharacterized protein BDZ83DRAFT_614856 [Colletotrichum acutatum]|uniref:Uncharacterized protein n=1 Tax=Glomerella acutata TaxID=27357 RepID=A0AAD8XIX4_GLOAC|nr:uncharacterized protein BDZ83DRAFT_614856 [Colletotrichum acutatum]KAK1726823.1 hypothetical protein BDZ83DRAFT_614856 [Colletotrichum acutatum]